MGTIQSLALVVGKDQNTDFGNPQQLTRARGPNYPHGASVQEDP